LDLTTGAIMVGYSRVNDDADDKQLATFSNEELHNKDDDFAYFPEPLNLGQRQLSILEMINKN